MIKELGSTELPENWQWCYTKEISQLINGDRGKNYPSRKYYISKGIPFLSAGNIDKGRILVNDLNYISQERYDLLNSGKLIEGDILYCLRGTLGKSAIFTGLKNGAIASSLVIIRIIHPIKKKFIHYYLDSPEGKQLIKHFDNGTAQPNLSAKSVSSYPIPLAPLPEQRAIVAKIEQLFSELDNGVANLKAAKDKLAIFRQAVLQKAFEGELTKEWRKQQTDLPTADELLEQIKQAQVKHDNKQLEKWKQSVDTWSASGKEGKKPTKPKKKCNVDLPGNKLQLIPKEWLSATISMFLSLNRKGMTTGPFGTLLKKSDHQESGIPVLGIENIGEGTFKMPNKIFVSPEKARELSSFNAVQGDILISRSGTVGEICAITRDIGNAFISTNLIRISLNETLANSKYFVYLFQGGVVREQVRKLCKGSTRSFLNQTILNSITFPFPSNKEQTQIVQEIETRLSVCDNAIANIEESLTKAEALRQSILKKAFAGKLLTNTELQACRQEPDWEPAAKLLERIKQDKKSTPVKKNKR